MKDIYTVSEVVNKYAFFILDDYSESNWTITAFDQEGNLIADKLFGAEERLILEWYYPSILATLLEEYSNFTF